MEKGLRANGFATSVVGDGDTVLSWAITGDFDLIVLDLGLPAREFALLELFLRHPSQVLTREQILSHVWGYDFDPGSNVVDVYVRALRRKIGNERIQTVRGMGYRLVP